MPQISTGSDFFVKTGNTFADRFIRDIGKQNFTTKGRSPVGPVAFREGVRGAQEADVDLRGPLGGNHVLIFLGIVIHAAENL